MPNCVSFRHVVTGQLVSMWELDEAICAYFGVEVHETEYYSNWYDTIAFGLALGQTFDQLLEDYYYSPLKCSIIRYLRSWYTHDTWAER